MSLNQKPHIDGLFMRWMVNFGDMGDRSQQFEVKKKSQQVFLNSIGTIYINPAHPRHEKTSNITILNIKPIHNCTFLTILILKIKIKHPRINPILISSRIKFIFIKYSI
jgi:hypothetical protein